LPLLNPAKTVGKSKRGDTNLDFEGWWFHSIFDAFKIKVLPLGLVIVAWVFLDFRKVLVTQNRAS